MLVAGTVPWPHGIFPQNRCRSDDVLCTCTHVTCYATAGVVGWGGLGMMTFFALAHMWHATQLPGWWGGVGWGWWRSLHLHTCDMLRNCWGGGVGWVGDDDVLCTCTHVTCYATAGVVGWGGLGMMTFFALAHMWHATQLLGWWGGVGWGWWRSLHLWKLAWNRHKSFSPNWGWLALGRHRWKKELVSGFGKKDLFVVKHGITGRFAIACASWSRGPGHGVTC